MRTGEGVDRGAVESARSSRTLVDRPRAILVCLAVAVAAAATWILSLDSHLTFVADDWELLVVRQGWDAGVFLDPYHENIVVGPAIVYRFLLLVFGMASALPFFVFSVGLFLASAVLLFALLRKRVGEWPALVGVVLLLFLGAAFEDLLWAFQMGYFGSMVAGLGMLLALEREESRADLVAAALLTVSLGFSSLGLTFVVGAAVAVALGRRRWTERIHAVAVPLAFYVFWWVGWGHNSESNLGADNIVHLPEFVFEAAAAGFTSMFGLATGDGSEPSQPHLIWGKLLLIPFAAGIGWRIYRERELPRGLAVALALALFFWISAALVQNADRLPTSSRYQYGSTIFLLLIAAEVLQGVRIPKLAIVAAAVITGLAISGSTSLMHREYEERWRPTGESLRSFLAAVDIAGPSGDSGFRIAFAPSPVASAGHYLAAVEDYGSPAYNEAELEMRSQVDRERADALLAELLDLRLLPPGEEARIGCETLRASSDGATGVMFRDGVFTLANEARADVEVVLGRFAEGFPVSLGPLPPGASTSLTITPDGSPRPWSLGLEGAGPVWLCTARVQP